jgi:ketosteroid isomerase-like protein
MIEQSYSNGTSPREIFERFLRASVDNAWDDLANLYSPDVVIEIPFAPPGVPQLTEGREVIRERFKGAAGMRQFQKADSVIVHETHDPELIIVEYDLHGQVTTTGRLFINKYIMVIRVRDGQIVSSRDYANPLTGAVAFDILPQLFSALTGEDESV